MRIIKDRDQYLMRNLSRGYSREDLNISYIDELLLKVNRFFSQKFTPCLRRKKK